MVGYCVEGMNNVVVACFKLTKQFCLSVVFIQDGRIFGKWKFLFNGVSTVNGTVKTGSFSRTSKTSSETHESQEKYEKGAEKSQKSQAHQKRKIASVGCGFQQGLVSLESEIALF